MISTLASEGFWPRPLPFVGSAVAVEITLVAFVGWTILLLTGLWTMLQSTPRTDRKNRFMPRLDRQAFREVSSRRLLPALLLILVGAALAATVINYIVDRIGG